MPLTDLEQQLLRELERLSEQYKTEQLQQLAVVATLSERVESLATQVAKLQTQVESLPEDYQRILRICEQLKTDYARIIDVLNEA